MKSKPTAKQIIENNKNAFLSYIIADKMYYCVWDDKNSTSNPFVFPINVAASDDTVYTRVMKITDVEHYIKLAELQDTLKPLNHIYERTEID